VVRVTYKYRLLNGQDAAVIRLLLFIVALLSGAASIWMFLNRPEQAVPVEVAVEEVPVVEEVEVEDVGGPSVDASEKPLIQYDVLVAADDILQGTRLSRFAIEWALFDEAEIPAGAFIRQDYPNADRLVLGQIVDQSLSEGDFIIAANLAEAEQKSLSTILEPGERAISISVTEDIMAGGFILPGDSVDIIHVIPRDEGEAESRVLARNVEVIALDQNMSDSITGTSYVGSTATFVVDVRELPIITAAIEAPGRISLALRSISENDDSEQNIDTIDVEEEQSTVRVIRNGVEEKITVRP